MHNTSTGQRLAVIVDGLAREFTSLAALVNELPRIARESGVAMRDLQIVDLPPLSLLTPGDPMAHPAPLNRAQRRAKKHRSNR
jgi:hypothetical protein